MGEVIANMSMSLDGFVEDATGSAPPLFGWIEKLMPPGDPLGDAERANVELFQEASAGVGAVVCGRRLVDLVPVLLCAGKPFFADLVDAPVRLGTPRVVQGAGVTHLRYRVERAEP